MKRHGQLSHMKTSGNNQTLASTTDAEFWTVSVLQQGHEITEVWTRDYTDLDEARHAAEQLQDTHNCTYEEVSE